MTTKTTGSFNNNATPPVDAQYLNILRDEMNALSVIDGTTLDSSGLVNSQQAEAVKAYVSQAGILCTDSGSSANSYILTASSPFTNPPLKTGTRVRFKTANSNTGSSTITPFGGSAITCKKSDGSTNLTTGDIPANTEVEFVYNGTNFVQSIGRTPATTTTQGIAFLSNPITISNNSTDANNDIDFSAGNIEFSDGSGQATYAGGTGQLDVLFGTGNGMLATGTKAINSTYHLYMVSNLTTGVSKPLAILGVGGTAPDPTSVLPSGYTKFQDRGSILTDGSGNIRPFTQDKKYFTLTTPVLSQSLTLSVNTRGSYAITTPLGKNVNANITAGNSKNGSGSSQTWISDLDTADINPILSSGFETIKCNMTYETNNEIWRKTNKSSQIGIRTNNSTSSTEIKIVTMGWEDINLKF